MGKLTLNDEKKETIEGSRYFELKTSRLNSQLFLL